MSAPANPQELASLAATVRAEHAAAGRALRTSLDHAMAAGDALIAARNLVPALGWTLFVIRDVGMSERTARDYVRLAKARTVITDRQRAAGPFSLRQALAFLREPRKKSQRQHAAGPQPTATPESEKFDTKLSAILRKALSLIKEPISSNEAEALACVRQFAVALTAKGHDLNDVHVELRRPTTTRGARRAA
jgi:hypothetical protein